MIITKIQPKHDEEVVTVIIGFWIFKKIVTFQGSGTIWYHYPSGQTVSTLRTISLIQAIKMFKWAQEAEISK